RRFASVPRSSPPDGGGARSNRRGRFVRRRIHGIHCVAEKPGPRSFQTGYVLWWRDGLVRCRTLRDRASAIADAQRNRCALPGIPRAYPHRMNKNAALAIPRRVFGYVLKLRAFNHRPYASRLAGFQSPLIAPFLAISGTAALVFFYSQNEILLSGDAVAHINIARRV